MKRTLGLLALLFTLHIYAETTEDQMTDKKLLQGVVLDKGTSGNIDTSPRSVMPFACVYSDGALQLTLLGEVGEFTLTVTSRTTGECWSVSNALYLKTSSAAGTYSVQIVTEDGTSYYGTYTL